MKPKRAKKPADAEVNDTMKSKKSPKANGRPTKKAKGRGR